MEKHVVLVEHNKDQIVFRVQEGSTEYILYKADHDVEQDSSKHICSINNDFFSHILRDAVWTVSAGTPEQPEQPEQPKRLIARGKYCIGGQSFGYTFTFKCMDKYAQQGWKSDYERLRRGVHDTIRREHEACARDFYHDRYKWYRFDEHTRKMRENRHAFFERFNEVYWLHEKARQKHPAVDWKKEFNRLEADLNSLGWACIWGGDVVYVGKEDNDDEG